MAILFGTKDVRLEFDAVNGCLQQAFYQEQSIPLQSKLWKVQTGSGELGIADMAGFRYERYEKVLKLFWHSDKARVIVTLRVDQEEKLRMHISVDMMDGDAICEVRFPLMEGMSFRKDNYLLITWQNGRLLKNAVDTFFSKGAEVPFWVGRGQYGYENEYPAALSFQYTTFYSEDYGYYFATEDPDAYIKTYTYDYNREKHALYFTVVHYPENMGKTTSYSMNYDFVFRMYQGDWQTATKYYREWAIRQKWCGKRLSERRLPKKLVQTDLWRINHTNYELGTRTQEYFDTSVKLQEELDCNLALHWYGWNMGVHDKDYPEYISDEKKAQGWPDKLREWNAAFDEKGIVKLPYHNARLWEKKTASWTGENAAALAIKDINGELLDEPWMPWMGYELKAMCPATAGWQNKVADLCREYGTELGFDGVYLDQIASYNATLCFDETHPHPAGGGTWWNDTYHRMIDKVRDIVGDDFILTTESCCESYVDVFDLFLILDTNFQYTAFNAMSRGNAYSVPLFSMIYGEYALSYGSICKFSNRLEHFTYNFIRNLIWGILPSIEGVDGAELEKGKEYLEVVAKGVDFFKAHKEVFFYGHLTELPDCGCDTLQMEWLAKDEAGNTFAYEKDTPAVCAAIWQTAEGESVIMAYNFSEKSQAVQVGCERREIGAGEFLYDYLTK